MLANSGGFASISSPSIRRRVRLQRAVDMSSTSLMAGPCNRERAAVSASEVNQEAASMADDLAALRCTLE